MQQNVRTTGLLLTGLICIIALNVMVWFSWHTSYILNDGVQYLSTARNWLQGHGFSTSALMYTPHFQGVLPAPQTVWPPGYPLALAMITMVGLSLQQGSLLINLISLAASAFLVFAILRRENLSFRAALGCALIFYCTVMPWSYSLALVTEPLFSTLILVAIYFQPNDVQGKVGPWIASGLVIALCLFTHYSGVLFAAGVGLGMFVYLIKYYRNDLNRFWRGIGLLTLQLSIPVAVFVAMLYRTYLLTGTTNRNIGVVETELDWFSRLKVNIWQVSEFLGFTSGGFLPGTVSTLLFCLFILLFSAVLTQLLLVTLKRSDQALVKNTTNGNSMRYLVVAHGIVFAAFFGLHIVGISLVELNHRYLYQVYPGFFILFCILVAESFKKINRLNLTGWNKGLRLLLGPLLCVYAIAQVNSASALKYYASPGVQSQEVVALKVSEGINFQDMIQTCFANSDSVAGSIWSNDGQQLHQATGVSTITIADVYGNRPYDLEMVRSTISSYDIKMFVILNNLPDIAPQYVKLLSEIKLWLEQNGYIKVVMLENEISSGITVDTYVVDQSCFNPN